MSRKRKNIHTSNQIFKQAKFLLFFFFPNGLNDARHGQLFFYSVLFFPSNNALYLYTIVNVFFSGVFKCDRKRVTRYPILSKRFNEFQFLHPSPICTPLPFFFCIRGGRMCANISMGHFYLVHINEMQFNLFFGSKIRPFSQ